MKRLAAFVVLGVLLVGGAVGQSLRELLDWIRAMHTHEDQDSLPSKPRFLISLLMLPAIFLVATSLPKERLSMAKYQLGKEEKMVKRGLTP